MTNADKYLKDGVKLEDFAIWLSNALFERRIGVDIQPKAIADCLANTIKPQLTEDERVILSNINIDNFNCIGKDKITSELYLAPFKDCSCDDRVYWFESMFSYLFQFIKERRRI